jgi:hypothetical protein
MPSLFLLAYKFKYFFSFKNLLVGGTLIIPICDVAFSCNRVVPFFPLLFFYCVYDPLN